MGGLSLSLSAGPVPAKLVTRIQSGHFVEMRDLLGNNVALSQHFEAVQSSLLAATFLPFSTRLRLREISSLQSWIYCFLTYIAVRTSDWVTRDWLVYARLIVRQASLHGGQGWLDYDRLFRFHQIGGGCGFRSLPGSLHFCSGPGQNHQFPMILSCFGQHAVLVFWGS